MRHVRPAYVIGGGFVIATMALLMLTQLPEKNGLVLLLIGVIALAVGLARCSRSSRR